MMMMKKDHILLSFLLINLLNEPITNRNCCLLSECEYTHLILLVCQYLLMLLHKKVSKQNLWTTRAVRMSSLIGVSTVCNYLLSLVGITLR